MALRSKFQQLELPASADFHVHLRDGAMMRAVVPTIRQGGVNTVYVMPNLIPPITTVAQASAYHSKLQSLAPNVTFLMTLYLHRSMTPSTIQAAKASGIISGIKVYPAGVTTNAQDGVLSGDYSSLYPLFAEMERQDLVLNLHGEKPASNEADEAGAVTVLNAEEAFLPTLADLHARFPRLRIVLEHVSTAAAVAAIQACGPTVAATITPHHLLLTVDDWAADPFAFCKPVAKLPSDRAALLRAAASGHPRFFLGSDSAPHPVEAKRGGKRGTAPTAAGVFTQPYVTQLVLDALERAVDAGVLRPEQVEPEVLEGFLGRFGRAFYRVGGEEGRAAERIVLEHRRERIMEVMRGEEEEEEEEDGADASDAEAGAVEVVPFRRGEQTWSLRWV